MAEAFIAGEACRSILAKQEAEYNSTVIAIGTEIITTLISVGTMVAIFVGNNPMFVELCMRIAAGEVPMDALRDFIRDLYNQVGDKIADFINDVTGKANDAGSNYNNSSAGNPPPPLDPNGLDVIRDMINRKLDYIFGNASGTQHNINRSIDMERQLNRIGIYDNVEGREIVSDHLYNTYIDPTSILKVQESTGRIIRESLLAGPEGIVKFRSIWEGSKLITVEIFGG
jgi:hypothetical protein